MLRQFLLLVSCLMTFHLHGQTDTVLSKCIASESLSITQQEKLFQKVDSCGPHDSIKAQLIKALDEWRTEGFLSASLDTFYSTKEGHYLELYLGKKYVLSHVSIPPELNSILSIKTLEILESPSGKYAEKPLEVIEQVRQNLWSKGYIKSQIGLIPEFSKDSIEGRLLYNAQLKVDLGERIVLGEVVTRGDTIISDRFLSNYLFWERNEPYDQKLFDDVPRRLRNLPYLKSSEEPRLALEYDAANLILSLEKEKANIFDFVFGILPAHTIQERSVIFSIYLNTVLHNLLKAGEKIEVKFVNTKPETQELNLSFQYPFMLNSPLGVFGDFQLFRDEQTHVDLKYRVGVSLNSSSNLDWSVYFERFTSSLLNPDTSFLIANQRLPDELDFSTNRFGVSVNYQDVDYIYAPRKGLTFRTGFSLGQKNIPINGTLINTQNAGVEVAELYDSLDVEQNQLEVNYDIRGYIPLSSRWTLAGYLRGQHLLGEGALLQNELYRIGGSQLLRGFDEQFYSVNQYILTTMELRFFLDRRSYFSAFADVAYLDRSSLEQSFSGWVNGIGLGINFQTTVGVFNLNYAIGSGLSLPFDINAGKIHFGYVSLF